MTLFRGQWRLLNLLNPSPLGFGYFLIQPQLSASAAVSKLFPINFAHNSWHLFSRMVDEIELNKSSKDNSTQYSYSINILDVLLKEIINAKSLGGRSGLGDEKIKSLCGMYKVLDKTHKNIFILKLAKDYAVDHGKVHSAADLLSDVSDTNEAKLFKIEDGLRNALTPQYTWLFQRIGRLENGVKFLVDLRADILNCIVETDPSKNVWNALQQLNISLRDLLALWFSIGFLRLERITWRSPCEMLQKISEYEAVHPVRNWTDIKSRVGPYRRCFVFIHNNMADEPLVVLHTALCDEIPTNLAGIVNARTRMHSSDQMTLLHHLPENTKRIKAGIFYSITSTQRGLQGIDLGNYLIKRVVRELQAEFPHLTQFSTLSPIPGFRPWLIERIKMVDRGKTEIFNSKELERIQSLIGGDFWLELLRILRNNIWVDNIELSNHLKNPLMRLCARYLYLEKRRGLALCSVGNFHLSNGALLWRINWRADMSPRGLGNSFGIMVNYSIQISSYVEEMSRFYQKIGKKSSYKKLCLGQDLGLVTLKERYFLEDAEQHSQQYLSEHIIAVSEEVKQLSSFTQAITLASKM